MSTIELGNKNFKDFKIEELTEFLIFGGLFNQRHQIGGVIVQFWETPVITDMHWVDDTLWFNFDTKHIEKEYVKSEVGYISFDDFCIYYESNRRCYIDHLDLKSINWLIKKGYNLPFENFNPGSQITHQN